MSKPYPAFCRDCKHSREKVDPYRSNEPVRELRCIHPKVNADSSWALSDPNPRVTKDCRYERDEGWLSPCGKRGRLWEPKS